MSINIGNFNNINRYNTIDNNLNINSYTNSNIILLNTDVDSYNDTIINFKNIYFTGFKNNNYIISDNNNNNIISLSYDSIFLNKKTYINNNININNLITTTNNTINLNSNLNISLKNTSNFISVYDNNSNIILGIINSNIFVNLNGLNYININSNINFYQDFLIKDNKTLYVDTIKSSSLGSNIIIFNPILYGLKVVSSVFNDSIYIKNDKIYKDTTFLIEKYSNNCNIIDIFSCNLSFNNKPVRKFCITDDGFISISSNLPNASLYITNPPYNITSNIIFYDGFHSGDKFIINNKANIGIGTTNPINLLQIDRNDDLTDNDIRINPIIGLNINYNPTSNYTTSNTLVSTFYLYDYIDKSYDKLDNFIFSKSIIKNNININYHNNISVFQEFSSNIQNTFVVNNNDSINFENITYTFPSEIPILLNNSYNFYIFTKINFPNIFSYQIRNDNYNTQTLIDTKPIYNYFYNFNLMSLDTYNNGKYENNINNFHIISNSNVILNTNDIQLNIVLNIYIEKTIYYYYYIEPLPLLQSAPPLLYATSNNNFTFSISDKGSLSLGSLPPNDNYYLYTTGNARIDNIECYNLKSISGKHNINFSDCNISNINIIVANSNICNYLKSDNAFINNLSTNSISIVNQNTNYINSSNINFINLSSTNTYFNPNFINFYSPLYFGTNNSFNNSSYIKINADNSINGIEITTNNLGVNPAFSLTSSSIYSYPIINLSNTNSSYCIKLNSNIYNTNYTECFQIFNNNNNNNIIQHINSYNLLNIGTNNITIDLNTPNNYTNSTNKISINIPYRYLIQNNLLINNWSYYFFNNIVNTPYMLNSYGSINFSTINNIPIIKGFINEINPLYEKVYIGLCGEPNFTNNVAITGSLLATDNIITSNNLFVANNTYVTNNLYAGSIGSLSDIRIKTDLIVIKNSLKKINNISCYNYTRKDTGLKEIGLIAQEVQEFFPELVKIDNNLLHINYGNMTAILIDCIKELSEKIKNIEKFLNINNMETD